MGMIVEKTLTSKGLVLYYSATGNTKALVDLLDKNKYDVYSVLAFDLSDLKKYDVIVLGMSTWERGMPPRPFKGVAKALSSTKRKSYLLLGSGRVDYKYFCGALDLYKQLLEPHNYVHRDIIRADGYPTPNLIKEARKIIREFEDYAFK